MVYPKSRYSSHVLAPDACLSQESVTMSISLRDKSFAKLYERVSQEIRGLCKRTTQAWETWKNKE